MTRCISFLCLTFIFGAFSCSKSDGAAAVEKTPREILVESTWIYSAYKENGVSISTTTCQFDDEVTFTTSGNSTFTDGAIRCGSSFYPSTDVYGFNSNGTMNWGFFGTGTLTFNSAKTSFTFTKTGASTFEHVFVKK